MNQTLDLIHNRRSIRNYAQTPLSREEKDAILDAAMRAPTAGNMMLYSIIEVDDQTLKDRLAVSCDNQPFIAKAPFVLLFLADYQRWVDLFQYGNVEAKCSEKNAIARQPQEGDLLLACCDALIAAQTAVIAAESMGIGSCYIGDILENYEIHQEMFDLPQFTLPISLLCFGRPAFIHEESHITRRFDRKFIIYQDRYRKLEETDLVEMMKPSVEHQFPDQPLEKGTKLLAQNQYFRKFASDFSVEMSRSVQKWIGRWTGNEK